jgi:hypothetical protein
LRVDAIAPVRDDDDAGSRRRLGALQSLAADAQEERGEAVSEELEGLVVERDAHEVLEPASDRGGASGEDGLAANKRFRLEGLMEVEDAAANVGGGNGFCSAPRHAETQRRSPVVARRASRWRGRGRGLSRMDNGRLTRRRRCDNLGH